ncbi:hypothetical protein [Caballeronia sp. DA-9]|uniref:hypothetical protein n=1 Tax=Caballeronia sp. DA-9 TaxID=3436237 RepID=UPI003F663621
MPHSIIVFCCIWYALGFLSTLYLGIRSGKVTLEDVIMSIIGGFLGLFAVIVVLAIVGESITIWKKK